MKKYDIIVIGGGVSGANAAIEAAKNGLLVLLVEERLIGGTCLNCGCIPSKYLLKTAEEFEMIRKKTESGVWRGDLHLSYADFKKECQKTIQLLQRGMKNTLLQLNVNIVEGKGYLEGKKVIVNGEEYIGENIILATGSAPMIPDIEGLQDAISDGYAYTNENIFEDADWPDSLTVIGGGVSGIEIAYAYSLLGAKVTVMEAAPRILSMFDVEISDKVSQLLKQKNIDIRTNVQIEAIEDKELYFIEDGQPDSVKCRSIYISAGREPCNEYIPHDIQHDKRGFVITDQYMQTNVSNIYAVGDITGKGMLAYTGVEQAKIAVDYIAGNPINERNKLISQVLFLSPECMQVGVSEEEMLNNGVEYHKAELSMNYSGRFIINQNELSTVAFVKLLIDNHDVLIGAVMMSTNASEMAVMFEMMIEKQWTMNDIVSYIYPHPTECEIIHDCALNYLNNKKRTKEYE